MPVNIEKKEEQYFVILKINVFHFALQISIPQNLIRMQVQNQGNSQPIIISSASLQNQPQTILQMAQSPHNSGVYLNQHMTDE